MCGLKDRPNYQCQLGVAAVSRDTFFKMADNTFRDSDSSWEELADEYPINPIEEAKTFRHFYRQFFGNLSATCG